MAILVDSGRAALAAALKNEVIHLAWGEGDPDWDDTPVQAPTDATALVDEVGRKLATVKAFCAPDENGEIITDDGRFAYSETPTKYLLLRFSFDFEDAPTATIRELGVFMGTETDPGLPPGQTYFEGEEITSPGTLVTLERVTADQRSPTKRAIYELVLEI